MYHAIKSIILAVFLLSLGLATLQASETSLTITCGKTKASNKTLYPIDANAVKLMSKLRVKTCNTSKRVKAFIKSEGITVKVIKATQLQINEARLRLDGIEHGAFTWN